MFRTILVPLDGSPLAESALRHAAAVAAAFEAQVHLLRVIPIRQRPGAAPLDIIDRHLGRAEATAYLDAVAADLGDRGISVETEVLEGQPAEQIVEVIRGCRADLVVLTSHGAGGFTAFPLSGTAQKVITCAGVSVLLVPCGTAHRAMRDVVGYRRILVGLDGSRRGAWALGPASAVARATGAELTLAHVVRVPEIVEEPASAELRDAAERLVRLNRRAATHHLQDAAQQVAGPDLAVTTRVEVSGNVPDTLLGLADEDDADLVVLTAHGASVSARRAYGATAMQLLGGTRRPLLIAQDAPQRPEAATRSERATRRDTAVHHR